MKNKLICFSDTEYKQILEQSEKEERTFTAVVRNIIDDYYNKNRKNINED